MQNRKRNRYALAWRRLSATKVVSKCGRVVLMQHQGRAVWTVYVNSLRVAVAIDDRVARHEAVRAVRRAA